ncbi:hypothetical protein F3Y22_tig00002847pilonHSYRG00052 [Hibiscus syriacus]|uniref:Pentatricopeptide repeat-containing protein n=1 Tax=Hibiscus syriacus TaxID=106335 RepID=A0A6A3CNZ1_HIBSY|nr:hypothetical protein F3Y22_tig00002847pilonHSYRG00052 [Hibiscus syriacus]
MLVKEAIPGNPSNSRALYRHLVSLLQNPKILKKLTQIHTQIITNGFSQKNYILANLFSVYATSSNLQQACKLFETIEKPSTTAWNQIIRGCSRTSIPERSVELYKKMVATGVIPDGFNYSYVLSACARSGMLREGEQIHGRVLVDGYYCSNVFVRTNLINLYAVAGVGNDIGYAHEESSCGTGSGSVGGGITCAEMGDLELGKWIHSYIKETALFRDRPLLVSSNNSLIHMYASCGWIEEAYEVLRYMQERSMVSWTNMITGLSKHGFAQEAILLFECMISLRERGVKPDEITYIVVLFACSHAGFVEEGRHYFTQMTRHWGINPGIEHYCCMVDLLSRAGFLDKALNLIETMPVKLNDAVWDALLGGCRIHKNVDLASRVARKFDAELYCNDSAGYLTLLSNVYATTRRWQDVADVRQKMIDSGIKKSAVRSSVQINGVIHDFQAGDSSSKHASSINDILWQVTRQRRMW